MQRGDLGVLCVRRIGIAHESQRLASAGRGTFEQRAPGGLRQPSDRPSEQLPRDAEPVVPLEQAPPSTQDREVSGTRSLNARRNQARAPDSRHPEQQHQPAPPGFGAFHGRFDRSELALPLHQSARAQRHRGRDAVARHEAGNIVESGIPVACAAHDSHPCLSETVVDLCPARAWRTSSSNAPRGGWRSGLWPSALAQRLGDAGEGVAAAARGAAADALIVPASDPAPAAPTPFTNSRRDELLRLLMTAPPSTLTHSASWNRLGCAPCELTALSSTLISSNQP
jgi:hypothetical protein